MDELEFDEAVVYGEDADMDLSAAVDAALAFEISPLKPHRPSLHHHHHHEHAVAVLDTVLPDAGDADAEEGELLEAPSGPELDLPTATNGADAAASLPQVSAIGSGVGGAPSRATPLPGTPVEDLRELLSRKRPRDSSADDADVSADRDGMSADGTTGPAGTRGTNPGRGSGRGTTGRGRRGDGRGTRNENAAADSIAKSLNERKVSLIRRVVNTFGLDLAKRLQKEAMERHLEGALVKSGERERTLGGNFMQLLSQCVPKKEFNQMLKEEKKAQREYLQGLEARGVEITLPRKRARREGGEQEELAEEGVEEGEMPAQQDERDQRVKKKPRGGKKVRRKAAQAEKGEIALSGPGAADDAGGTGNGVAVGAAAGSSGGGDQAECLEGTAATGTTVAGSGDGEGEELGEEEEMFYEEWE